MFPFTWAGVSHSSCTTIDSSTTLWCATEIDTSGNTVTMTQCDQSCTGVTTTDTATTTTTGVTTTDTTMYVDPRNSPGGSCCKYHQ